MEISLIEASGTEVVRRTAAAQRVQLSPSVHAFVHMGLRGPGLPSTAKDRLWLLLAMLCLATAGYIGCEGFIAMDPGIKLASVVSVFCCVVEGGVLATRVLSCEVRWRTFRAVCVPA